MTGSDPPDVPPPQIVPVARPPLPTPPPAPYPFWSWQDVLVLALLALPLLIVSAVLIGSAFHLLSFAPRAKAVLPIAAQFLFYALWFLLVYELMRFRYGRPFWRSLAFIRLRQWAGRAALWGVLTAFAAIALAAALRPPVIKTPLDQLLQDPVSVMLMVIFGVTLGPLCEELAFRGLLLPLVVRAAGPAAGILLTAAPFAVLHGQEYAWSWQHLVVIFMAGSAFGWIRWHTGSTAASAISHGIYNLTFFIGFLASRNTGT